jgi:hypothetical protein
MRREAASDMGSDGAEAAIIFGMPPRMPPVPKSGESPFTAGGNCPNELGKVVGDGSQVDGSEDRKIGGCQAIAPARLAGICDQKAW